MSAWDALSVELIDEIFSHIAVPIVDSEFGAVHDQRGADNEYRVRDDLALRLVCKAFDRAMTRVYFQHEYARFQAWKENSTERLQEYVIGDRAVFAPYIRRLQIKLSETRTSPKSLFVKNYDKNDEPSWTFNPEPETLAAWRASVSAFIQKLEDAVSALPKLERLVITLDEEWRSEANAEVIEDDDDDDDDEYGLVLDLELLHLIRSNIARVFSSPRVHLPLLTDIHLELFSVYDLANIGSYVSDDLAMQLQHLYLEYIDGTGPGGDNQYTHNTMGGWDSDGDNDYHPYSNLQKRFPNTKYMGDLCALISRCHNLKSLGLKGTQCFDLDSLSWRPTHTGLEDLYISRGAASASTLISLLSASESVPATTSSIVNFEILDVQLQDGTWGAVFEHLLPSSTLTYINVYNVLYDKNGKSAQYHQVNGRPYENCDVIWTEEEQDTQSLRNLARKVHEKGGNVGGDLSLMVDEED